MGTKPKKKVRSLGPSACTRRATIEKSKKIDSSSRPTTKTTKNTKETATTAIKITLEVSYGARRTSSGYYLNPSKGTRSESRHAKKKKITVHPDQRGGVSMSSLIPHIHGILSSELAVSVSEQSLNNECVMLPSSDIVHIDTGKNPVGYFPLHSIDFRKWRFTESGLLQVVVVSKVRC